MQFVADHNGQRRMGIPSHGIFYFFLEIQVDQSVEVRGMPEKISLTDIGGLKQGFSNQGRILKALKMIAEFAR